MPDAGHVPSISVVVPIYNVEPYLAECLESLLAQTAGDLEVVMVDDGSTDGSAAIAERYAELDSGPCRGLARSTRLDMARRRTAQAITLLKPCGVGRAPEPAEQPAVAELGPVLR